MGRSEFLYKSFLSRLKYEPTPCQDSLLSKVADFVSDEKRQRRATPGSIAFVPSVAGLILAGEVIKDLSKR